MKIGKHHSMSFHFRVAACAVVLLTAMGASSPAVAAPLMTLRIPELGTTTFPNGSSVILPASGYGSVEIWLQDALAEVQVSSISVRLNEVPMATFITTNRLPRGVRVIVRLNASVNADFSFRPQRENILSLVASDVSSVEYTAQFYVTLSAAVSSARLAPTVPIRPPLREVKAPEQSSPPTIRIRSEWPHQTTERVVNLQVEVSDRDALRRVVIELNSRAIEEVILENEMPVRKKGGFIAKGKLPGTVTGDGKKLVIAIPVVLNNRLNTIGVRAQNVSDLVGYDDRTIELTSR